MRSNRPYVQIDADVLERVRQIDLLSYLREYEPSNLVKVKGTSNVYCTAEHDSLKISNGKWYWWSQGFGGYSALDYLIKVKGYAFVEAVETLSGQRMSDWIPPPPASILRKRNHAVHNHLRHQFRTEAHDAGTFVPVSAGGNKRFRFLRQIQVKRTAE